jgi:hypothetical protein
MTGETQNKVSPITSTQLAANGLNGLGALTDAFSDAFLVLDDQSGPYCDNPQGVGGIRETMGKLSRTPTPRLRVGDRRQVRSWIR